MATPFIQWKEEFETGLASLDYEHRQLVDLLNRLYETLVAEGSEDAVEAFLGEVYARISAHFALEERIMRERRYDQYREHKDDHERLLDEIRDIMDAYDTTAGASTQEFANRIETWFVRHFKTNDARLHRLLGV
jgi:hemerythrin-like metal-binding protein